MPGAGNVFMQLIARAPAGALIRFMSVLLLLSLAGPVVAGTSIGERLEGLFGSNAGDDILHPEDAFRLTVDDSNPARLQLTWEIADGYYLYRDKFSVTSDSDAVAVGGLQIPPGQIEGDPNFGEVAVHRDRVTVTAPLSRAAAKPGEFELTVGYQGCKEDSVCYPPQTRTLAMNMSPVPAAAATAAEPPAGSSQSAQDTITERLQTGGLWLNIAAFFSFGLLLSLTPCVFPMIPILSGVIVGQSGRDGRQISTVFGFMLSLAYVLALALTYAVLGIIAGSFHFNLQAAAQDPWILSLFAAVFVALALSMFGFYQLQLPAAWQSRLQSLGSQRSGSLWGAAIMGAVSAIIVGPCVAPPLAGALLYISQTGDALLGGTALFAMGLGFGMPLLLIGASAGRLLPAAGGWMETIKQVFGVIMLAVAVWFLGRILPDAVTLMLWALLLIISAVYMGALDSLQPGARWQRLWKGLGLALLVYGIVLMLAAVSGGSDPLRPLEGSRLQAPVSGNDKQQPEKLPFAAIKTVDDVRGARQQAALESRPVMLYFSAEWCVVCAELEQYTYRDAAVHKALSDFHLIKADVTDNDARDRALLQHYGLFGPPAILFFDADGDERRELRLVGFIDADDFVEHIGRISPP